jgi:hypothetical protein
MGWQTWAAAVGAIAGVGSILLWFFGAGRRVGQLETRLSAVESKIIDPKDWRELRNKVETLYKVYVIDALPRGGRRAGGNPHGNPHDGTNPGEKMRQMPREILELIKDYTVKNAEKDTYEIVSAVIEALAAKNPDLFIASLKSLEITPSKFVEQVAEEVDRLREKVEGNPP